MTILPAIIPLASLAAWTLQGAGARDFLQGYVTSDLGEMPAGRWQVTAFCTLKGRVLATAYVSGSASEVTLIMPREMVDPVLNSLKKFLAFARGCELSRPPLRVLGGIGDLPRESGFARVNLASEVPLGLKLAHSDEQAGGEETLWRWHEVQTGFAQITAPVSESFLPQMIGLDALAAVSYNKGCYLGQEVVTRAAHRGQVKRRLTRLSLPSTDSVSVGQKLRDAQGRERGTLVSFAPNPQDPEEIGALAVVSGDLDSPLFISERLTT